MHRAPRLFAALLVMISALGLSLSPTARAPEVPQAPVPPPGWVEVQNFFETRLTRLPDEEIKALTRTVVEEAERYAIDPSLIIGLIQVESSGNPRAISKVGAIGLMQLRPRTAQAVALERGLPWAGKESLYDPHFNVQLGVHYLAELIERFDDVDTALAAYNFGPTRIARAIRRGKSVPVRYAQAVQNYAT